MSESELDAIADKIDELLRPLCLEERVTVLHGLITCYHCGDQSEETCWCCNDE